MAHAQLDLCERRAIEDMLHAKVPVREMARVLNRVSPCAVNPR